MSCCTSGKFCFRSLVLFNLFPRSKRSEILATAFDRPQGSVLTEDSTFVGYVIKDKNVKQHAVVPLGLLVSQSNVRSYFLARLRSMALIGATESCCVDFKDV